MALALFSAGFVLKMAYIKAKLQRKLYYILSHNMAIAEETSNYAREK
jgi:hypothetical protein